MLQYFGQKKFIPPLAVRVETWNIFTHWRLVHTRGVCRALWLPCWSVLALTCVCVYIGRVSAVGCYSYLSTWCLPLIMVNNDDDDVIFREAGEVRKRVKKCTRNTVLHLMIFFHVFLQIQTLKMQWNADMMPTWLSTDRFQVHLCWERMGCGKKRRDSECLNEAPLELHVPHMGSVAALTC